MIGVLRSGHGKSPETAHSERSIACQPGLESPIPHPKSNHQGNRLGTARATVRPDAAVAGGCGACTVRCRRSRRTSRPGQGIVNVAALRSPRSVRPLPAREGSPRRAHYRGRAHLNGLALSLFPPAPFTKRGGQRSVAERNPPHIRPDGPGAAPRTTSTRRGVLPVPQRREEEPLDLPGLDQFTYGSQSGATPANAGSQHDRIRHPSP